MAGIWSCTYMWWQAIKEPAGKSDHERYCICKIGQAPVQGFQDTAAATQIKDVVVTQNNVFDNEYSGIEKLSPTGSVAMQATTISCSGICKSVKILSADKISNLCLWRPVHGDMTLDPITSKGTFDVKSLSRSFCGLRIQAEITENNPMPNYCKDLRTCELSHRLLEVVWAEWMVCRWCM